MSKSPNPIDKHVGNRVRMCRMAVNMSQTGLADELDITFQQVQKYEKGINRVSASRLMRIAGVFDVPIEFFFEESPGASGGASGLPSPAYVSDFLATSDGLALTRAFTNIASSKVRRCIVNVVEAISESSADPAGRS